MQQSEAAAQSEAQSAIERDRAIDSALAEVLAAIRACGATRFVLQSDWRSVSGVRRQWWTIWLYGDWGTLGQSRGGQGASPSEALRAATAPGMGAFGALAQSGAVGRALPTVQPQVDPNDLF